MTTHNALAEILYQEDMRSKGFPYQVNNLVVAEIVSALEKQIPKKPKWSMGWVCPNCKHEEILNFPKRPEWDDLFCKKCGQALDWGDRE